MRRDEGAGQRGQASRDREHASRQDFPHLPDGWRRHEGPMKSLQRMYHRLIQLFRHDHPAADGLWHAQASGFPTLLVPPLPVPDGMGPAARHAAEEGDSMRTRDMPRTGFEPVLQP